MAVDFYAKAGDRAPAIVSALTDDKGAAIDLTGATVRFLMRPLGEATPLVNAAGETVDPDTGGIVRYFWAAGDLAEAGTYLAEWRVTFPDARVQTFPGDRQLVIMVSPGAEDAPTISPEDLDWLRTWVGSTPGDDDLAARLDRLGSVTAVALGILQTRRADLLVDPLSYTIRGDVTVNATDNLRALDASIAALESVAAAEDPEGTADALAGARLVRVGTWGRGWNGRR